MNLYQIVLILVSYQVLERKIMFLVLQYIMKNFQFYVIIIYNVSRYIEAEI